MRLSKLLLFLALIPATGFGATCGAYNWQMKFDVNPANGKVGTSTVAHYPMVISGTYIPMADLAHGGQSINFPDDIVLFSDAACTTKLDFVRLSANNTTGAVQFYVYPGSLFGTISGTHTTVYAGIGNMAVNTDQQNTAGFCTDISLTAFYPLQDNAANTTVTELCNSLSGTNSANTSTKSIAGPNGSGLSLALNYTGADQTALPSSVLFEMPATYSTYTWIKQNSQAAGQVAFAFGTFATNGFFAQVASTVSSVTIHSYNSGQGDTVGTVLTGLTAGVWHDIGFTSAGGTPTANGLKGYVDGANTANTSSWTITNSGAIAPVLANYTGGGLNANEGLSGFMVGSGIVWPADWYLARHNNEASPATFYDASGLPLVVSTVSLPNAIRGVVYSQTVSAIGGTSPYTWSITVGSLPTGLSLNTSTGVISGTPTVTGSVGFTIKVTDAAMAMATQPLSIFTEAATCTLTLTGNVNLTATAGTWTGVKCPAGGGYIPGVGETGDTVTLAGSNPAFTLTVDESLWSIGSSTQGGYTSAVSIAITSGHQLTVGGQSFHNGGDLTLNGGATLTLDNSSSSAGNHISLTTSTNGGLAKSMHFICNGSAGTHGSITGIANSNGDQPSIEDLAAVSQDFGSMNGTGYCDFSNLGGVSYPGWSFGSNIVTSGAGINVAHITCTHCGTFPQSSAANYYNASLNLSMSYWSYSQTIGSNNVYIVNTNAPTGGATYTVDHSTFDAAFNYPNAEINGLLVDDSVFGGVNATANGFWAVGGTFSATNNVLGFSNLGPNITGAPITFTHDVELQYGNSNTNTHMSTWNNVATNYLVGPTVLEETALASALPSDGFVLEGVVGTSLLTLSGVITPPNPQGFIGPAWATVALDAWATPGTIALAHNSGIIGKGGANGACFLLSHVAANNSNVITPAQNNICYSGTPGGGGVEGIIGAGNARNDFASSIIDYLVPSTANHNNTFGLPVPTATSCYMNSSCGQTVQGYLLNLTSSPGTGDITSDPSFPDTYRSILFFDCAYMGFCSEPAWSSSTSYAYGAIVSYTNASYWQNHISRKTVNFRCGLAAGCPASTPADEPIAGANWGFYWEPAVLYQLRQATIAGTTYVDGALGCTTASPCSPAAVAVRWVEAAYIPQNRQLCSASTDHLLSAISGTPVASDSSDLLTGGTSGATGHLHFLDNVVLTPGVTGTGGVITTASGTFKIGETVTQAGSSASFTLGRVLDMGALQCLPAYAGIL